MYTVEELKKHLSSATALTKAITRKEVALLPGLLTEGEQVFSIMPGVEKDHVSTGLFVATSKRIMFVDKKLFGGADTSDYVLSKINSISHKKNILTKHIVEVQFSGSNLTFYSNDGDAAKHFVDSVRSLII